MLVTSRMLSCYSTHERFVDALCDAWQVHFSSNPTGTFRPTNYLFPRTLTCSLSPQENDPSPSRKDNINCDLEAFSVSY
jgi:hypothetical protein